MSTDPTHIEQAMYEILRDSIDMDPKETKELVQKLLVGMCCVKEILRGTKVDLENSQYEGKKTLLRVIAALNG